MTDYPKRKHPRLKEFDYSRNGAYFVTFCTQKREMILGRVGRDDLGAPCIRLTELGAIVEYHLLGIPGAYPNVTLENHVVMPNHVHLLLRIDGPEGGAPGSSRPTQLVPRIVAAVKRFTNRDAGKTLWQPSFHDHMIRDENDFLNHWSYIETNPARWAEDAYYISQGKEL